MIQFVHNYRYKGKRKRGRKGCTHISWRNGTFFISAIILSMLPVILFQVDSLFLPSPLVFSFRSLFLFCFSFFGFASCGLYFYFPDSFRLFIFAILYLSISFFSSKGSCVFELNRPVRTDIMIGQNKGLKKWARSLEFTNFYFSAKL
jgi:hypothetical protein